MDTRDFRDWLNRRDTLSGRSVSDVVSRLNRLAGLVDIQKIKARSDLDVALIKSSDFNDLTRTVRSQLKRSGQLWIEFRKETQ